MSDDLIKRSNAIKALNREKSDWNCDYNVPIDNCIKRLNKVKPADRPQGKWVKDENWDYRCSECGGCEEQFIYGTENWYGRGESKFCPNCGAQMKGADE